MLFQAEPERTPVVLKDDEYKGVLKACPDATWQAMYKIAYNARLRRNEIVYLAWDDVDFKNETITVCNSDGHSTKSRKIRTLPMNSDIIKALKSLRLRMFQNPYVYRDRLNESLFLHTFEQIVINVGHVITKDGIKKTSSYSTIWAGPLGRIWPTKA